MVSTHERCSEPYRSNGSSRSLRSSLGHASPSTASLSSSTSNGTNDDTLAAVLAGLDPVARAKLVAMLIKGA